jgi:predicted dehydrogenase
MTAQRLRIGLVGAGWVSRHHLLGGQAQARRAQVVAIADPSRESRVARVEAFGIERNFPDLRAMLDTVPLDAVDICAPRETHVQLVRLAAERGLPVLCQKPLAPVLAEAEALVRAVDGRVRLMVHENWRFRPYYRQARRWTEKAASAPCGRRAWTC